MCFKWVYLRFFCNLPDSRSYSEVNVTPDVGLVVDGEAGMDGEHGIFSSDWMDMIG
jgi:hypothetical protein